MKKAIFATLFLACALIGCSKIDEKDPVSVLKSFILLCEAGEISQAEELLAPNNDVDYFRKYKDKGKDMMYINHDYKGNDDIIELTYELLENLSSNDTAVIKLTSNYIKQNQKFDKVVVLKNIDGKWKIKDFLFMPVKVK